MSNFQVGIQVIIRKDNAILLGRRKKSYGFNTWGLPGGHLKLGESFEVAAAREVLEETSIIIRSACVFGVVNDPSLPHSHHIQIGLIATDWAGEPQNMEPHLCSEWNFFSGDQLPHPLFSSSASLIERYFNGMHIQAEPFLQLRGSDGALSLR